MKSANAPFNEYGQSMILRDIEDLYIDVDKINSSLFGLQTGTTSLSQQVAKNTSSIVTLQTSQTTDEAAIAALQTQVAGLFQPLTCGGYNSASGSVSPGTSVNVNPFTTYSAFASATLSGFNASTGVWTCPATGWYLFTVNVINAASGSATVDLLIQFAVTVNNIDTGGLQPSYFQRFDGLVGGTSSYTDQAFITRISYVTSGTTVSVSASAAFTQSRNITLTCNTFQITRLS